VQKFLDQNQKNLSEKEVMNLVDASSVLLKDNNFKVCQGTLHLLTLVAAMSGKYLKAHINQLVPTVVERLGDSKQTVRDADRRLLLDLMEVLFILSL
jgi:CLIP-associating protein 1/2